MAGDFDFFNDEPTARPKPKVEPPARNVPLAGPADEPVAGDRPRYRT